ncbi:MAG: inositol monophosphatase family protein, partial [Ilumatobacteraceae bacterium]
MTLLTEDLALALRAADVADGLSLPGFQRRRFTVERKADKSEVTELDRSTESAVSEVLRNERPDYSLYGEEHGVVGPTDAAFQWVIDPIDGTSNFVRGVPVWATLIALVHEGEPVLGVVSAPALGMRWWAARGLGAHYGTFDTSQQIHVSEVGELRRASASITVTESWHAAN